LKDLWPLSLRHWQGKMQSGAAIIDHDEDSSKAQEPPRRGHTSLPIATEKDGANLTNPAKEKQSSPETPPPLTESEGQNTPTATAGGSAEAAAVGEA
jgi:hypothetical protein